MKFLFIISEEKRVHNGFDFVKLILLILPAITQDFGHNIVFYNHSSFFLDTYN